MRIRYESAGLPGNPPFESPDPRLNLAIKVPGNPVGASVLTRLWGRRFWWFAYCG